MGYLAIAPNQVWSWDITWLPTAIRGMFFYLYMIVDVYSRKIVGWEVHPMESAELGAALVSKAILAEGCWRDPPVLHADNGAPQKGFAMKAKLEALGVTPSYSRPRVSNDNPYSESLFRTVKYRPEYPVKGFADIGTARRWVGAFVAWYNDEHRHGAIRHVTPSQRHNGEDIHILARRHEVYQRARLRRQDRWTGPTRNWEPIVEVWLNRPKDLEDADPASYRWLASPRPPFTAAAASGESARARMGHTSSSERGPILHGSLERPPERDALQLT